MTVMADEQAANSPIEPGSCWQAKPGHQKPENLFVQKLEVMGLDEKNGNIQVRFRCTAGQMKGCDRSMPITTFLAQFVPIPKLPTAR
jgi:hypothetical protein